MSIVACDKSSNNDPANNVEQATKEPDLQNKIFRGECDLKVLGSIATGIATGGDAAIKGAREQFQFVGANVTHAILLYNTTDCTGSESIIYKETGAFEIDDGQRTADDAKFMDLNYDKLTVNTVNQDGATIAHALKLCGTEDWVVGSDRDVTANAGDLLCYKQKEPRRNKQVYKVDGATLYFGTKGLLESDDTRPTALDTATKYIAN